MCNPANQARYYPPQISTKGDGVVSGRALGQSCPGTTWASVNICGGNEEMAGWLGPDAAVSLIDEKKEKLHPALEALMRQTATRPG